MPLNERLRFDVRLRTAARDSQLCIRARGRAAGGGVGGGVPEVRSGAGTRSSDEKESVAILASEFSVTSRAIAGVKRALDVLGERRSCGLEARAEHVGSAVLVAHAGAALIPREVGCLTDPFPHRVKAIPLTSNIAGHVVAEYWGGRGLTVISVR